MKGWRNWPQLLVLYFLDKKSEVGKTPKIHEKSFKLGLHHKNRNKKKLVLDEFTDVYDLMEYNQPNYLVFFE